MMATMNAGPVTSDVFTALFAVAGSFVAAFWLGLESGRRKARALEAAA